MKIKIKNNPNLVSLTIQDKSKVESLYITDNNSSIDIWSIFDSIRQTNHNQLTGKPIRLGTINRTGGTWKELQDIKNTYKGFDIDGHEIPVPALIGTWHLIGMHEGEYDISHEELDFGGDLNIVADKMLVTFSDNEVETIINNTWGSIYDYNLNNNTPKKGISLDEISEISSIGAAFQASTIESFPEFEYFTGLSSLQDSAFSSCIDLTSITLPKNIGSVGNNTFANCTNLTSITYSENIMAIGSNQITNCSNLDYIRIPGKKITAANISVRDDSFGPGNYKIYVGDGSSPYHDNAILNLILSNPSWNTYKNKLDTWYNKLTEDSLPSGYKRLDYIESDGINYINPDILFSNNTRFVADISFENISESGGVYGNRNSGLIGYPGITGGLYFTVKDPSKNPHVITFEEGSSWVNGTEHLYDIDIFNGVIKYDEESQYQANMTVSEGKITFFGDNESSYVGKAWMTRIYENDSLAYDFIPAYNTSSGVVGFYESINGTFYNVSTYVGSGFDTRLLMEDGGRILTESGDFIQVSNTNSIYTKISNMDTGTSNNITPNSYYIPGYVSSANETKSYSLYNLKYNSSVLSSLIGLSDFSSSQTYSIGDFVYYNNKCYQFIKAHQGTWNNFDVTETSAFDYISEKKLAKNKEKLNINLGSKAPIFLDYIESLGTDNSYVNTGLIINTSSTVYFEFKFEYSKNSYDEGYILGDYYNASTNTTKLYINQDESAVICCGNKQNTTISSISQNVPHTVTLKRDEVIIDGSTTTLSITAGNTNQSYYLGLFCGRGNSGEYKSPLNIKFYYFKVYNVSDNSCVCELKPAFYAGKYCMFNTLTWSNSVGGTISEASVHDLINYGNFRCPNNFNNPFSNKQVIIKSNIDSYLITDLKGETSTDSIRRDKIYNIQSNIEGYYQLNNNYYSGKDEDIKTLILEKNSSDSISINITFSGISNSELSGKTMYAISDIKKSCINYFQSITLSDSDSVTVENIPKNSYVILKYPDITGYTSPNPNNESIKIEDSNIDITAQYIPTS